MSSQTRAVFRTALGVALLWLSIPVLQAQEGYQQLERHLGSGEFTKALSIANSAADERLADQMYQRIATAQRTGGAGQQAFSTASLIDDGAVRNDTYRFLHQQGSSMLSGFGSGAGFQGESSQPAGPRGAGGGVTEADFQELMDLILETIDPDSWEDNGGSGRMFPFPSGVYVDSAGTLQKIKSGPDKNLDQVRRAARAGSGQPLQTQTELRKVSLPRLERAAELLVAQGKPVSDEMRHVAGIYEIKYVLLYPETNDIVIAGPAGPWRYDQQGRAINIETGRPVLYLDDLVVCLRNADEFNGQFGCSIDPRAENLAEFQRFSETTSLQGRRFGQRLREILGQQDVTVQGIDAATHAGSVIVEADYRMKLVGMGLEPGVTGLRSYLDRLQLDDDGNPPESDMVRWWFTMNYDAISANDDRTIYEISGQGVKVLSESEFMGEQGQRVHTGKSSTPAKGFAEDFTRSFLSMSQQYPVYGELKNLFDCALVANLIKAERLGRQAGWGARFFSPDSNDPADLVYPVAVASVPVQVNSVINEKAFSSRNLPGRRPTKTTVYGVSGGVTYNARSVAAREKIEIRADADLPQKHRQSVPDSDQWHNWWWD